MSPAEQRVLNTARVLGSALANYSAALVRWRAEYPSETSLAAVSQEGWARIVHPACLAMIDARIDLEKASRVLYDGAEVPFASPAVAT